MLELENLRFFYHVAKNLSFTAAASDLHVTQPSVTKRIKNLEESINLKLFGKSRGKTFLTEEGRILFVKVKKIFQYETEVEKIVSDIQELKRGTLRLGLPATYTRSSLAILMDEFHKQYPDIKIQVNTGNSKEIVESLLNRKNEIGNLAMVSGDNPEIEFVSLSRDNVILLTSPEHPFAQKKFVTIENLANEPIVLRETGSGTRKAVLSFFKKNKITPNILLETTNSEYIKQMVIRGDGISFLVERTISQEIREGKLVKIDIKGHEISIDLYIAYLKNVPLSLPAKAYLEIFKKRVQKYGET